MKKRPAIEDLIRVMARLRAPNGCPWDKEQDHRTLRWHAVEEVYELMEAIEVRDDHLMEEELGDLLLQVVFHCQLGRERGAFNFEKVARNITNKLIRRHPHVFGKTKVKDVDQVWANWEKIKKVEKHGTRHARASVLDGIPRHLPGLLRVEKLMKKARRGKLIEEAAKSNKSGKQAIGKKLFELAAEAQRRGWSAEDLLRRETSEQERRLRCKEKRLQ